MTSFPDKLWSGIQGNLVFKKTYLRFDLVIYTNMFTITHVRNEVNDANILFW